MNLRERVEFCIALANRIADERGVPKASRVRMGLRAKGHDCLMCELYQESECRNCPIDSFCVFFHGKERNTDERLEIFEDTFYNLAVEFDDVW